MAQTTDQHALATYVSDMLALAQHAAQPLSMQVDDEAIVKLPEARAIVSKLKQTVDAQVQRLDAHLAELGGHELKDVKNVVSSILGSGASAIDKMRKTRASKALRDDQTALTLMTISYTMLETTALALNDQPTASLAQRCLEELTPIVMQISRCIPTVVVSELQDEGLSVNPSAAQAVQERISKAWSN